MFPGYSDFKEKKYASALPQIRFVAEAGHPEAQAMMGCYYQLGFDVVAIDEAIAISWYERASSQGDGVASNNLAGMRLVEGDIEAAKSLYQLSRAQGFRHGPTWP